MRSYVGLTPAVAAPQNPYGALRVVGKITLFRQATTTEQRAIFQRICHVGCLWFEPVYILLIGAENIGALNAQFLRFQRY